MRLKSDGNLPLCLKTLPSNPRNSKEKKTNSDLLLILMESLFHEIEQIKLLFFMSPWCVWLFIQFASTEKEGNKESFIKIKLVAFSSTIVCRQQTKNRRNTKKRSVCSRIKVFKGETAEEKKLNFQDDKINRYLDLFFFYFGFLRKQVAHKKSLTTKGSNVPVDKAALRLSHWKMNELMPDRNRSTGMTRSCVLRSK